jgi:hypothetical protein
MPIEGRRFVTLVDAVLVTLLLLSPAAGATPFPGAAATPASGFKQEGFDVVGFLNTWAALAAYLALLPWIVQFSSWLVRRIDVDVKQVEIGFSLAGPAVALDGFVIAIRDSAIISDMRVLLHRQSDNTNHVLSWNMSRHHSFKSASGVAGVEGSMEVARPFLVPSDTVSVFNIVFTAPDWARNASAICQRLQSSWLAYLQANSTVYPSFATGQATPQIMNPAFQSFRLTPDFARASNELQNEFNQWLPGRYRLTLLTTPYGFRRARRKAWTFSLDSTQLLTLSTNVDAILVGACGQLAPNWIWNFLYPDFSLLN